MNQTKYYFRWISLCITSGLLAGLSSSLFLILLEKATETRKTHTELLFLLPLGGFAVGWLYHHLSPSSEKGNNLVLEEVYKPKKRLPSLMAPFVLLGTLITHLLGGSAGREGTAVQMGAAFSDQISRWIKLTDKERQTLLVIGSGAGFGSAIGAPWAGVLFGMEVLYPGRIQWSYLFPSLIASFIAALVTHGLQAPHTLYPQVSLPSLDLKLCLWVCFSGVAFGLCAFLFSRITSQFKKTFNKYISYPPLRPLIGGIILISLFYWEGSYIYAGLGLETIQKSLIDSFSIEVPFLKLLFTALTLAAGYKGGEFTPLVFIGSTLGCAISPWIPLDPGFLAALGFAAVFAGASNTPIACTVMAAEIFGAPIIPFALLSCSTSFYFSGHRGIYSSQIYYRKKYHHLLKVIPGRKH